MTKSWNMRILSGATFNGIIFILVHMISNLLLQPNAEQLCSCVRVTSLIFFSLFLTSSYRSLTVSLKPGKRLKAAIQGKQAESKKLNARALKTETDCEEKLSR